MGHGLLVGSARMVALLCLDQSGVCSCLPLADASGVECLGGLEPSRVKPSQIQSDLQSKALARLQATKLAHLFQG